MQGSSGMQPLEVELECSSQIKRKISYFNIPLSLLGVGSRI